MSPCDSSPLHAPAVGTFLTTSNGDAVEMPLCDPCLRHRITAALDNGEAFHTTTILAEPVRRRRIVRDSKGCWT